MALVASTTTGCGASFSGDCSGGTADGAGNCIPYDRGPEVAQRAALTHFGERAEQVVCVNKGPFRYHRAQYHEYQCFPIRDGQWQRGADDRYCVIVHGAGAISDAEVSAILVVRPRQQKLCAEY